MLVHLRGLNPHPTCPPGLNSHITEDEYLFRRGRKGRLYGEASSEKILMKQREISGFAGGDPEWRPLCHKSDSWKGNLRFLSVGWSVSSGRNISKEVNAVPHDISSPFSGNSTV